jgi:O-antigen ligase
LRYVPMPDLYQFSHALVDYSIIPTNYLALYVGMALFILYAQMSTGAKYMVAAVILAIFFIAFLGIASTRTPLLAVTVIIVIAGVWKVIWKKDKRQLLLISVVGLMAVLLTLTLPALYQRVEVMVRMGAEGDWRYYEFSSAWKLIKENPLIGYGFIDYEKQLIAEYQRIGWNEGVNYRFNAHNQILQTGLEQGVLGVMILLLLYGFTTRDAFRCHNFSAVAFVFFFILCSITEALLFRNKGIMFYSVFCGILIMTPVKPNANSN